MALKDLIVHEELTAKDTIEEVKKLWNIWSHRVVGKKNLTKGQLNEEIAWFYKQLQMVEKLTNPES